MVLFVHVGSSLSDDIVGCLLGRFSEHRAPSHHPPNPVTIQNAMYNNLRLFHYSTRLIYAQSLKVAKYLQAINTSLTCITLEPFFKVERRNAIAILPIKYVKDSDFPQSAVASRQLCHFNHGKRQWSSISLPVRHFWHGRRSYDLRRSFYFCLNEKGGF